MGYPVEFKILMGFLGCFIIMAAMLSIHVGDGRAADPADSGNHAILTLAARGGPLPDLYAPLPAELVAMEYGVERTLVTDIHTVTASVIFHGDHRIAHVWLIADKTYTKPDCGGGAVAPLQPGEATIVTGCFTLPAGERPTAAMVVAGGRTNIFDIGREVWTVMQLPLFGEAPPSGLVCETSHDGSVCSREAEYR